MGCLQCCFGCRSLFFRSASKGFLISLLCLTEILQGNTLHFPGFFHLTHRLAVGIHIPSQFLKVQAATTPECLFHLHDGTRYRFLILRIGIFKVCRAGIFFRFFKRVTYYITKHAAKTAEHRRPVDILMDGLRFQRGHFYGLFLFKALYFTAVSCLFRLPDLFGILRGNGQPALLVSAVFFQVVVKGVTFGAELIQGDILQRLVTAVGRILIKGGKFLQDLFRYVVELFL